MDSVGLLPTAHQIADTVAANSGAIIDFARVSVPFGESGMVNGWIVTGIGIFVVISCLAIIIFAITMVPIFLSWFNKHFPENTAEKKEIKQNAPSASIEATAAAAIAVSYHNYHNN